jgi:hypothetical protein
MATAFVASLYLVPSDVRQLDRENPRQVPPESPPPDTTSDSTFTHCPCRLDSPTAPSRPTQIKWRCGCTGLVSLLSFAALSRFPIDPAGPPLPALMGLHATGLLPALFLPLLLTMALFLGPLVCVALDSHRKMHFEMSWSQASQCVTLASQHVTPRLTMPRRVVPCH